MLLQICKERYRRSVNNISAESGNDITAESITILILVYWKQSCQKLGD
jgi:hypothetical protein